MKIYKIILAIAVLLALAGPAAAATITISDEASSTSISGTWNDTTSTCSIDNYTIAYGDTLVISSGVTLHINESGTLTNSGGYIENNGTINSPGTINNNRGTINNYGTIYNSGNRIYNYVGTINNNDGGTIYNYVKIYNRGTINNNDGGTIYNYGTIYGGTIKNYDTIYNYGSIHNVPMGKIYNYGTINNYGTIYNENIRATIIYNYGTINNIGSASRIVNSLTGTFNNYGTINNNGGMILPIATFNNYGTINNNNGGTIYSYGGTINNNNGGTINNNDDNEFFCSINNNDGGTINNYNLTHYSGTINNKGTINNYGTSYGHGTIYNACEGIITGNSFIGNDIIQLECPFPGESVNLQNTTGNFWVNHTWKAGSGSLTDSYNVSVNSIWYNGTTDTYYNNTDVSPHGWSNITVFAFNNSGSGSLSASAISQNTQVPNNVPVISADESTVTVNEGQTAVNNGIVNDADGDDITLSASVGTVVNNNDDTWSWSFDTTDGPDDSQTVTITADDGNGGVTETTFELIVNNVAPIIIEVSNNGSIIEGGNITINITANDLGIDVLSYAIDWNNDSIFEPLTDSIAIHKFENAGEFTVNVQVTDEDGTMTSSQTVVIVLTTQQAIEKQINEVEKLINEEILNEGQDNGLNAKLENIIAKIDKGNIKPAINQLEAFINQINGFISEGLLSPEEGQPLIDAANEIIDVLNQ